jgi:DNA-binding LacI/PurR family transcriptional regulator
MHAIRALRTRGIKVPSDVSVIGFDDLSSQLGFHPAITSVQSPRFEMGQRSVELITGDPDKQPVELIFPVQLVERNSTSKIV